MHVIESILPEMEQKVLVNPYSSMTPAKLLNALRARKLAISGTPAAQIKRLRADDRKRWSKAKAELPSLKAELESEIGHAMMSEQEFWDENNSRRAEDAQIQMEAQPTRRPIPRCKYDWKDSRWASKTQRELHQICRSWGNLPGWGPKATLIKWLDTRTMDYEDMCVSSLQKICGERGLRAKFDSKKVDLIRILRDADESAEDE